MNQRAFHQFLHKEMGESEVGGGGGWEAGGMGSIRQKKDEDGDDDGATRARKEERGPTWRTRPGRAPALDAFGCMSANHERVRDEEAMKRLCLIGWGRRMGCRCKLLSVCSSKRERVKEREKNVACDVIKAEPRT